MKKFLFVFLGPILFSVNVSYAEFIAGSDMSGTDEDVIIDSRFADDLPREEPSFSNRKVERDVARFQVQSGTQEFESLGQLSVLKEIPYSYPQLSRRTLQMRVLNEIEAEETQSVEK